MMPTRFPAFVSRITYTYSLYSIVPLYIQPHVILDSKLTDMFVHSCRTTHFHVPLFPHFASPTARHLNLDIRIPQSSKPKLNL